MIDFQWHINDALINVARFVANRALDSIWSTDWHYNTSIANDVLTIRVARRGQKDARYKVMTFDIAGCTIDAALLEELHNEVTAWFTAIKEGAK